MVTETVRNYEAMSEVGASIIFADAMKRLWKGERYNLGLATGNTMITLYTLLACFAEQTAPLKAIFAKGTPTPFLPASYLWRHPDYHLVYTTDKIAL